MKCLPLGWGLSTMPCHFTHKLCRALPDKQICKNNNMNISYQPAKFQMCIETIDITCTPPPNDEALGQLTFGQASGHADIWLDEPPKTSIGQV